MHLKVSVETIQLQIPSIIEYHKVYTVSYNNNYIVNIVHIINTCSCIYKSLDYKEFVVRFGIALIGRTSVRRYPTFPRFGN